MEPLKGNFRHAPPSTKASNVSLSTRRWPPLAKPSLSRTAPGLADIERQIAFMIWLFAESASFAASKLFSESTIFIACLPQPCPSSSCPCIRARVSCTRGLM